MRKTLILILYVFGLLNSCTKENSDIRLPQLQTPNLTGFVLKDIDGSLLKTIGIPNINVGKDPVILIMYPNPADEILAIYLNEPDLSKAKIWIVQGEYLNSTVYSEVSIGSNVLIAGGNPLYQFNGINSNQQFINLEDIPDGFYRVYFSNGINIYWDNLIVNHK